MLALALALRLVVAAPEESADEEAARRFAELIDEAANRGELESALRLIDEAERLYPHHRWHFFRASVLSETGDCDKAIVEYDAYLAEETLLANVESAQAGRDACAERIAQEAEPASPPEPSPTPENVEPQPVDAPPTEPKPWARDPAAIALVTTGLVGVGVGAALLIQGTRQRDAAENAGALAEFETEFRSARRIHTAGIVTTAVAAVLVVGGVIRFAVVGARARNRRVSAYVPFVVAF